MGDCLFCRIISKEIKSEIVFENDDVLIFKDVNPKAPVHLLAVPKKHVSSILDVEKLSENEITGLINSISKIAREFEIDRDGFRVVTNSGASAGQSVDHLHFHIMGKRLFTWPPG
ncbi:MAG: histidine triad nucleotide-binding protein [Actinobacteria bacterium]|nr:histidine triad nucleotide-binding protein [Actinomycetota bacterium]